MNILIEDCEDQSIGTIFSSNDNSPDVDHFLFILDEIEKNNSKNTNFCVRQGKYCYSFSDDGMIIGKIESIFIQNEYYNNPNTVKKFDKGTLNGIQEFFPSEKWENYIGYVKIYGVFPFNEDSTISNTIKRSSFPCKPGNKVFILTGEKLKSFLGIDDDGLNVGTLENYNINIKLNPHRLINKHFAILAMSGAGKSYLVSVILEELLSRKDDAMTPGILLIDVHGEYKFISEPDLPENNYFAMKTKYYDGKYFEIDVSTLNAFDFKRYQPNISRPQLRELRKVIDKLKNQKKEKKIISYDINDIISELEQLNNANQKVIDTLIGWLSELQRYNVFSNSENPKPNKLISKGRLSILDLSKIINIKKKQMIVSYLLEKLFLMRRNNKIPPYLIILEEAHQFAPEGQLGGNCLSKRIIETIAREGRKFYSQICLISQRPVKLSTTALSQCNTHIILRVTNPNDLVHIKNSSEALTNESLRMISTLPTGNAMIMGSASNLPLFLKVRTRNCINPYGEENLEEACKNFRTK
ncbi:MAG: ATP-binding protein [archaeon]|nr:ATP-binding protein [archaeon]